MEAVSLDGADLTVVLGSLGDGEIAVRRTLSRSALALRALGDEFRTRAGWTGEGLELHVFPSGQQSIVGFVEPSDVSFYVELRPPGFYDESSPRWEVEATISVRCDAPTDCGMHTVETVAEKATDSADAATDALADAVIEIAKRARSVPMKHWREADPRAGHT